LYFDLIGYEDCCSRGEENFDVSRRRLRWYYSPRKNRVVRRGGGQLPGLRGIKMTSHQLGIGEQGNQASREEPAVPDFGSFSILAERKLGEIALESVAADNCIFINDDEPFVIGPA